ncbi:MAG TPA: SpoIIE family protein phosphatase [bacterium]|nr:SpoIIE family protein phosphatase [bacterium]
MTDKEKRRLNLHWQFAILVGLLVLVTATGLTWFLVASERANLYQGLQTSLVRQGRTVARTLSPIARDPDAGEGIVRTLAEVLEDNPHLTGAYYFDDRGGIYSADEEIVPLNVGGEPAELGSLRAREELVSDGGSFCLTLPVYHPARPPGDFTTLGKLRLVMSAEPVRLALERATVNGVLIGAAAFLITTGLGVLFILRILGPLKELQRGVRKLGAGNITYRLKASARNELGRLAAAVNDLAERLENPRDASGDRGRLLRDLEIARQLQLSYLPDEPPDYPGMAVAGLCEPAFEVGGDYYDFIPIDERRLGVVVADVSGKSLQGLMVMLILRTILKSTAPRHFDALPTLCETNTLLSPDMRSGNFVTCLYYVYDSRNGSLDVVNAGHNSMLVFRASEKLVEVVKTRGRPLGLIEPDEFCRTLESTTLRLEPGDTVLLYTDGVSEAMNEEMEIFGDRRLQDAFAASAELAPPELVKRLAETARAFAGEKRQFDDMTLVALKALEPEVEEPLDVDLAEEVSLTVDRYISEGG